MNSALSDAAREKLIAIIGMLGSDHAGERASAGLKADRIVREAGLTWRELLTPSPVEPPGSGALYRWHEPEGVEEQLDVADRFTAFLNDWECEFLVGMRDRATYTPKQEAKLQRLIDYIRGIAHRPEEFEAAA